MIRKPRLVADQQGFTLVELLAAMVIGSVVLTVVMNVFLAGLSNSGKVTDRVEATQRARMATDRMTTLLQAQVCDVNRVAPISAATATSVTFTANMGDAFAVPTRYTLRFDAATKNLYEDASTGTIPTRILATDMAPYNGVIFKYYAFDDSTGLIGTSPLVLPLSAADLKTIVRVDTSVTATPERTKVVDPRATTIFGQAITGSADPSTSDTRNEGPNC